jgi:hypothetical protein
MNISEIESYFDAIDFFDKVFDKGKMSAEETVKKMYKHWPNTTLRLTAQGFFMAIVERN